MAGVLSWSLRTDCRVAGGRLGALAAVLVLAAQPKASSPDPRFDLPLAAPACSRSDAGSRGLRIDRRSSHVVLSWPLSSSGLILESTPDPDLTHWLPALEVPETQNDLWEVTAQIDQPRRYFRLQSVPPQTRTVLTNSSLDTLEDAVGRGGVVALLFDGTVDFTRTLVISTNTILDASGHNVLFDGKARVRQIVVNPGVTLRLVHLTLTNGYFVPSEAATSQPGNPAWGGAIYSRGGSVELADCILTKSTVAGGSGGPLAEYGGLFDPPPTRGAPGYGGAVAILDGLLRVTNCVFALNSAMGGSGRSNWRIPVRGTDAFGGALYSSNSAVSLVEVTFANNLVQAADPSGGRGDDGSGQAYGGALGGDGGTLQISNCLFQANRAVGSNGTGSFTGNGNGGAIYHASGWMDIEASLFLTNTAVGGGALGGGGTSPNASSGFGGALLNASGHVEIRTSSFLFNEARGAPIGAALWLPSYGGAGVGGAICNRGESVRLINCTLVENSANGGAGSPGGGAHGGAISGDAALLNVTIANNSVRVGPSESGPMGLMSPMAIGSSHFGSVSLTNTILLCRPDQTNLYSTVQDGGHNLCSDNSASFTDLTSRMHTDPLLGPIGDNGGPTPTMPLLPGSPAVDAGDNQVCPAHDQRGVARPVGSACDIGAFEWVPP